MSVRPAFKLDTGGTLRFRPADGGAVTAATVSIYRAGETTAAVDAASATISTGGDELSYTFASSVPSLLGVYRAAWSYTIDGVSYDADQTFDVVRRVLRPTLTAGRLIEHYPILDQRVSESHATILGHAWGVLFGWLKHRGISNPHLIIDALQLEHVHAALSAYMIARSFEPGSASSADAPWQAFAAERYAEAQALLDKTQGALDLDSDDDGHLGTAETAQATRRIRLSR
jgi:hypothetical protein